MNKEESAAYLGRSVRQLERLVSAKRIASYKVKTAKGQVADFHVEDLDRLKNELDEEEGRIVVSSGEDQGSPVITASVLATTRKPLLESLSQKSAALATVPQQESTLAMTGDNREKSPVFAGVFAASLRVLLSVDDVCELSQLSEKRVRDALKSGELKGRRIGHAWRIHREDFDAWVRGLI